MPKRTERQNDLIYFNCFRDFISEDLIDAFLMNDSDVDELEDDIDFIDDIIDEISSRRYYSRENKVMKHSILLDVFHNYDQKNWV
jgi:hypothetical protein